MRPLVAAPVLLLALLVAAPAASAATAVVETQVNTGKGCTADPVTCQQSTLVYTAAAGEANDVQISYAGSSLLVRDPAVDIQPGQGCQRQGQNMVRCTPPEGPGMGFVGLRAQLGDLGDALQNGANLASRVEAGAGDDRVVGGTSFDALIGGAGRDQLEGAAGTDFLSDDGGVEPDVLDGGDGRDSLSYAARTAGVVVDLRNPANPSGEPGENDSLVRIEQAHGGRGPDLMRAGNEPVEFYGRGGNDKLLGTFGADRLFGDSGNDKLHGFGGRDRLVGGTGDDGLNAGCGPAKLYGQDGRDRLYSANGAKDGRVHGGAGRDFARIDQLDAPQLVERVQRVHIDGCAL